MKTLSRNRGGFRGHAGLLMLGLILVLAAAVPARAATPAQLVLLDTDPEYGDVIVTTPAGAAVAATPGQFQLQVTPAGGVPTVHQGFCVDTEHPIGQGTVYDISLQTADDDPFLASPGANAAAWLIQEADAFIAAAPDPALEAGALQVAIWVSLGEALAAAPTDDPVLNARAAALLALAQGKGPAGPVSISAAASFDMRRRARHHAQPDGHPGRDGVAGRHLRPGHPLGEHRHLRPRRHRIGHPRLAGRRRRPGHGDLDRLPAHPRDAPAGRRHRAAGDRLHDPAHLHRLGDGRLHRLRRHRRRRPAPAPGRPPRVREWSRPHGSA